MYIEVFIEEEDEFRRLCIDAHIRAVLERIVKLRAVFWVSHLGTAERVRSIMRARR